MKALANTNQTTIWYYFHSPTNNKWYIVDVWGEVLLLDDVGSECGGGVCWKPINNRPSTSSRYPSQGSNFSGLSISTDGGSVTFGRLASATSDGDITALANSVQTVYWLFFDEPSVGWYINWAPDASTVYYLDRTDPSVSGGILWEPVYNADPVGTQTYPPARQTFTSVTKTRDRLVTTFGAAGNGTTPGNQPPPTIVAHGPDPIVVLDGLQTLKLSGHDFQSGATVTVGASWGHADLRGAPAVRWIDANTLKILLNVGTKQPEQWYVRVTNPDGTSSKEDYHFTVSKPTSYPSDGTYIGELNGVIIRSGANVETTDYQCTEFATRYYWERFRNANNGNGINTPDGHMLDGKYWYDQRALKGLAGTANDATSAPREENILVFSGGKHGHVAIVSEVGSDYVVIAQQNYTTSAGIQYAYYRLSLTHYTDSAGQVRYKVGNLGSGYSVIGWLWPDGSKCAGGKCAS